MLDMDGPIDATFSVEALPNGEFGIYFGSWSKPKGAPGAKNSEYAKGLETLFSRLSKLGASVRLVELAPLTQSETKRLNLVGKPYPWNLSGFLDAQQLRVELGRAQAAANQTPGTGNRTKRLCIHCTVPGFITAETLTQAISSGEVADIQWGDAAGFQASAEIRSAVEECAMATALGYYEALGWDVDPSVAKTESFDLLCKRKGEVLHAEVKGTTGLGREVLLTWREVEHARNFPNVALVVVSRIEVNYGPPPTARGGTTAVFDPWRIEDCLLSPTQYRCAVPLVT